MVKQEMQPACLDYTLNLHKRLQGIQFKKRAPRAIRNIKRFAQKEMFVEVSLACPLIPYSLSSGDSPKDNLASFLIFLDTPFNILCFVL